MRRRCCYGAERFASDAEMLRIRVPSNHTSTTKSSETKTDAEMIDSARLSYNIALSSYTTHARTRNR